MVNPNGFDEFPSPECLTNKPGLGSRFILLQVSCLPNQTHKNPIFFRGKRSTWDYSPQTRPGSAKRDWPARVLWFSNMILTASAKKKKKKKKKARELLSLRPNL